MRLAIFLLLIALNSAAFSQKSRFLALEVGGSGGLASLNYEQSIFQKEIHELRFRAGFSIAPIDARNGKALVFPIMVHWLAGRGKHRLDLGAGQTISITTKGHFFPRAPLCIGYHLEPPARNFYFRIAYTPILSYLLNWQWENWAGIAIGFKIGRKS